MEIDANSRIVNNKIVTEVLDAGFDGFCDIVGLRSWNLIFVKKLELILKKDFTDVSVKSEYQSLLDFNKIMLTARFPVRLNATDEAPTKYSPFSIIYRKWVTNDGEIKEYNNDNFALLNSFDTFVARGDISMNFNLSDFTVFMEQYFDNLFLVFKQSAINMQSYNRCVYSDALSDINNIFYSKAAEIVFDENFTRKNLKNIFPIVKALKDEKVINDET